MNKTKNEMNETFFFFNLTTLLTSISRTEFIFIVIRDELTNFQILFTVFTHCLQME